MQGKILLAIILFGASLILPGRVFAQNTVVLPKDQTVNHDYFAAGNMVDIEGTVNGDVYAAGGNVLINGTVNGDILAAGGNVTIRGMVHNVRVAGGQVILEGTVNGNVTAGGGNVTIGSGANVLGSLVGAGGQFTLLGPVDKTVNLSAGQATVSNLVGSDIAVSGGQLILTSDAKVNGDVWYMSNNNATIPPGTVSGKVTHTYPPQRQEERNVPAFLSGILFAFSLGNFLIELIVGLVLISLVPLYARRTQEVIVSHPWLSLGIGLLTWVLTPFVLVVLVVTIIGIPFAVVGSILLVILGYIGKILVSLTIGVWVADRFEKRENVVLALILGLIIVELVGWIPIIGWFFLAVVSAIGLGATLIMERNYYSELRAKNLI